MKSPQNHFCPFWSLSNFTLPNIPKCSQTSWTFSNVLIIHLDQVAQVGEQVNLIKVPQNPSCPEPNFNNSTLPTFSTWPQLWWACSHDQMRPLHLVVHQREVISLTRSKQIHFCRFLGFAKVTLWTLSKWAQIFTTAPPSLLLPLVTLPWPFLNDWGVKYPHLPP